MKSFGWIFPAILLLSISVFSQTPTPPPVETDDVVRITTTLIQIDATVTERGGKPITDLRQDEVEIYENGKKQKITHFSFVSGNQTELPKTQVTKDEIGIPVPPIKLEPNQIRRTIALVVDDISLSFESTHFVRRALKNFVDNQMQEGDLVAIIRTGSGIGALQQFTSDKRVLYAAIEKVRWKMSGGGGIGAFAPIEPELPRASGEPEPDPFLPDFAEENEAFREDRFASGTLGAVEYVIRGMRELPGRKSVMLLSDGFALTRQDSRGLTQSTRIMGALNRLIDQANRSSVVVYTMDARGLQVGGFSAADNLSGRTQGQLLGLLSDRIAKLFDTQAGLVYLAKSTGGIATYNNNDINEGIARMLDDQSYYLIGYEPDEEVFDPQKRRFNNLDVKVTRDGARVRFRSGFFGMTDEQIKPPMGKMTDTQRILHALTSPFSINDLSLSLNTVFRAESKKNLKVTSILYVDLKDLTFTTGPDGLKNAAFDLVAYNFGDNGIPADSIHKTFTLALKPENYEALINDGIVYAFDFPVKKPGSYQMRVAIRDHGSQKVGSANQFIEIPKLDDKRIKLSGMIVDNMSYQEWNASQDNQNNAIKAPDGSNGEGFSPLADTAVRKFKNGSVLTYALEIYNPTTKSGGSPQLESKTRFFRNGVLLFEGSMTPVNVGRQDDFSIIPLNGGINLATTLETGDYALQVVVFDKLAKKKKQIASQFIQFEIVE